jgi:glutamate-1-semialdehyde 2,1-aminomutase
MRAGLETLKLLAAPGFYEELNRKAGRLVAGLREALRPSGLAGQVNAAGSLLTLFFSQEPVKDYNGVKHSDTRRFATFFSEMLERGVFLPPSQFEALFVSAAHTEADIERTVAACRESLDAVQTRSAAGQAATD